MASAKTYRAAIIGCGKIANLHAIGYINNPRCEIAALADIEEGKAGAFAEERGISPALYRDHKAMLAAEKPDIVSICLWPHLHLPVVQDCVAAGVPAIHCEKPIATTWGECLELVECCETGGVQLTFNHQRRFNPRYKLAKEILDSGRVGKLERAEVYNPGHILDCGTHLIDFVFMYNNEEPVKWVFGQLDGREIKKWFGVPFEFAALGMFRLANGVRAILHSGDDREMGWGVRLFGSDGIIEIDGGDGEKVRVLGEGGWQEIPPKYEPEERRKVMMVGVFGNIMDCLESGQEPELGARRALQAAEVIFAMYESCRSRARIDLPLQTRDSALLAMLESGVIGHGTAD